MKRFYISLVLVAFCYYANAENIVFPEDCYYHNGKGGYIIDVTKPPFNAYNDGTHPDETTAALIAAYDTVLQDYTSFNTSPYIIYLPNGTYLINNTIIYSKELTFVGEYQEVLNNIRFQGQSEKGTIIKLDKNAIPFRNPHLPIPVMSFGKGVINNAVATNKFENITIDVGDCRGAVALRFHGANVASVRNVTIKSKGANYGIIGLDMPIYITQGIVQNLTVEGFKYGIKMTSDFATHPVFENITLKNQSIAGFYMGPGSCSVRNLHSINKVPAVHLAEDMGHMIIIDSKFEIGNIENAAIEFNNGHLFGRNLSCSGYGALIKNDCKIIYSNLELDGDFVSDTVLSLFEDTPKSSLNLTIEETPQFEWEDNLNNWISVNSMGAIPNDTLDDSWAIQKALDSGKPVVYFLGGRYTISRQLKIPTHVKMINFMYSELQPGYTFKDSVTGAFVVAEDSDDPLFMQEFFVRWHVHHKLHWIDHASTRTLVLKNIMCQRSPFYKNSVEGGKVFIEAVSSNRNERSICKTDFKFKGQKVWCRSINPEHSSGWEIVADNSDIWIFGYKTELNQREKPEGTFKLVNGSNFEILGGLMNNFNVETDENIEYIYSENSNLSFVAREWGEKEYSRMFKTVVKEIKRNELKILSHKDTHRRGEVDYYQLIPLFVGRYK